MIDGQSEDADVDVAEASSLTRLDSCTVQVDPPMTEATEHLRMPENLMNQLHITADMTPTGLVLTGEYVVNLSPYEKCAEFSYFYRCAKMITGTAVG